MQPGFFQSPQFLVTGILAISILAGAGAAYAVWGPELGGSTSSGSHHACDTILLPGAPITVPAANDATRSDGPGHSTRTVTYDLNVTAPKFALLRSCTSVGDLRFEPSPDGMAHVVFSIQGEPRAVQDSGVTVALAKTPEGSLQVAAWHSHAGTSRTLFHEQGASVDVTIRVPELGAPDVHGVTDVGGVLVSQLLVGNVTLRADVGDVRAMGVDVTGNVTMSSDVDKVELRAASIGSSNVKLRSNVGDVIAALPGRADIGYDATGVSDVGDVRVDIGPTEFRDSKSDGVGGNVHARSKDYESKLIKVIVDASSDVGGISIVAG